MEPQTPKQDVIDWIAQRAQEDPRIKKQLIHGESFTRLIASDEWKVLADHFKNGEEDYALGLAKRLMRGEVVTTDEIAYFRGFHEGARMVLRYPQITLTRLEKTASLGYAAYLEEEELSYSEEHSPYAS